MYYREIICKGVLWNIWLKVGISGGLL
jgi:hypothetical protein